MYYIFRKYILSQRAIHRSTVLVDTRVFSFFFFFFLTLMINYSSRAHVLYIMYNRLHDRTVLKKVENGNAKHNRVTWRFYAGKTVVVLSTVFAWAAWCNKNGTKSSRTYTILVIQTHGFYLPQGNQINHRSPR